MIIFKTETNPLKFNFILLCISFNLFQTLQRGNLVIHWDSMSKKDHIRPFFTKIKMEKKAGNRKSLNKT